MVKKIFRLTVFLFVLFAAVGAIDAKGFETPVNRRASEILPANMISGPHYTIREEVLTYGYMHHYTVESDYGVFKVTGDIALRKLLKEIQAIAALKKIQKSEAFVKAVGEAAKKPLYFGKDMVTDPVNTVSGLPKGVHRLFGNISKSITMTHDPSEDAKHKQMLLVSNYKREYAYKLGVDVYSSNQVLQKELNRVGWASAVGGLSVSAATAAAGSSAVSAISSMRLAKSINEALRAEPPSRLRLINEDKLLDMGLSKDLTEKFLDHPDFTPRHDTIIVESLTSLGNARGRDAFLKFALSADDEETANFFQHIAEIMTGYHAGVSPIVEIRVIDGMVLAKAKTESVLIPLPLDHGMWTREVDRISGNLAARFKASGFGGRLEVWITGTVSTMVRQRLKGRGIEVSENVDHRIALMD